MCNLPSDVPSKLKSFTGYKIVEKEDGKYYSPATEIQYTEGMTMPFLSHQEVPKRKRFINGFRTPHAILTTGYRERMQGRTAVFKKYGDARRAKAFLFSMAILPEGKGWSKRRYDTESIIVKMTISENLLEGSYDGFDVIAGSRIDKIEEIH